MIVLGVAERDEIIRTLNLPRVGPNLWAEVEAEYESNHHRANSIAALMSSIGQPSRFLETLGLKPIEGDEEALQRGVFGMKVRELVDEWLETGRSADGIEDPSKRDVFRTVKGLQAMERCASETPLRLFPLHKAHDFAIVFGMEPQQPKGGYYVPQLTNFFERASAQAGRLFLCLMLSDWNKSICKCRYAPCGQYYVLKKPRRNPSFCCVQHQRRASAVERVMNARADGERELLDAAARRLMRWKKTSFHWQDDDVLKERLAAKLNLVIADKGLHGYRDQVTRGWVTRHRGAIEQRRLEFTNRAVNVLSR
jgi:hypothetical protein